MFVDNKLKTNNSFHVFGAVELRFEVLLPGVLKIPEHQSDSHAYLQFSFSLDPNYVERGNKNCICPWPNSKKSLHVITNHLA